jgi:glycerol uptake facilitator-like aquaporin
MALRGSLARQDLVPYLSAQISGGIAGTLVAHLMFEVPILQLGSTARTGFGHWAGEFTATFTLLFVILATVRFRPEAVPWTVGLTITAAYWFTSSTSFANPAVTIARALSDSFAGIAPADVPAFVLAQLAGAWAALRLARFMLSESGVPVGTPAEPGEAHAG